MTYTLVYKNTGNSVATNVAVTDVLDAKLAYVAGSAQLMGVAKPIMILIPITISLLEIP